MDLNKYEFFVSQDYLEYVFYSVGPKGNIKKGIRYSKISDTPITYNLAFGDIDMSGALDDVVISNNQDRDIILATVAGSIHLFCNHHGNHFLYVEGSTPSRTRLYQMSIAKFWNDIREDFDVFGFTDEQWSPFHRLINYEAFLIKRK